MKKIATIILTIGASLIIATAGFAFGGYRMGGWGGYHMGPGYHMSGYNGTDRAPGYGPRMGWGQGPAGQGYNGPAGGYCWGYGNWQQPEYDGQPQPAPQGDDVINR